MAEKFRTKKHLVEDPPYDKELLCPVHHVPWEECRAQHYKEVTENGQTHYEYDPVFPDTKNAR